MKKMTSLNLQLSKFSDYVSLNIKVTKILFFFPLFCTQNSCLCGDPGLSIFGKEDL